MTKTGAFKGCTKVMNVDNEKISINIKKGIIDGQILKVTGKGNHSKSGGARGDLLIKTKIKDNDKIKREGNNLHIELPVDLYTAVLGGKKTISTFSGKLSLQIPPESKQGKVLKLSGQGMPIYGNENKRGDLYIKLVIDLPEKLSEEEKNLFKKLRDISLKN